jgi:membrane-associated phospholipid phosphatase
VKKIIIILISIFIGFSCAAQSLDYQFIYEVNAEERPKYLDNTFKFISNSTAAVTVAVPVGLLASGLLSHNANLVKQGKEAAFSFGISSLLTWALKNTIHRERPFAEHPEIVKLSSGGGYSLPSGHTSTAFALATSIALNNKKWYIIVPAYTWAGLVGYSRIHLGVHYPSDVIAGAAVGFVSAYAARKVNTWLHKEKHPAKSIAVF